MLWAALAVLEREGHNILAIITLHVSAGEFAGARISKCRALCRLVDKGSTELNAVAQGGGVVVVQAVIEDNGARLGDLAPRAPKGCALCAV